MEQLLQDIHGCQLCKSVLPNPPNPVLQASSTSQILIVGQAPGRLVHESGISWNDPSGDRLRQWLGIDKSVFYDATKIALVPMGFCYPGTGSSGDLPPRKECAPQWHGPLLENMPEVRMTFLIGSYAQKYYLGSQMKGNLTETVKRTADFLPNYMALPHPSPRNNIWIKKHPWFESEIVPLIRLVVKETLNLD